MAEKSAAVTYTLPILWSKQLGDKMQIVSVSKEDKLRIIFVHASRSKEVEIDNEKKTITMDVEQMANFKPVEFIPNTQILRITPAK